MPYGAAGTRELTVDRDLLAGGGGDRGGAREGHLEQVGGREGDAEAAGELWTTRQ